MAFRYSSFQPVEQFFWVIVPINGQGYPHLPGEQNNDFFAIPPSNLWNGLFGE